MARRLTPVQWRVLAVAAAGEMVRRRGAFGVEHAGADDPRFAASRTIDALWRRGLLRPSQSWGAYEATDQGKETHDARR
jgi:hypothetical protein